jgi:hypothetical protein
MDRQTDLYIASEFMWEIIQRVSYFFIWTITGTKILIIKS